MKLIILFILSIAFVGCMTTQKATDFLKKEDALDDICAENYPVRDSVIRGVDTITVTDTLETFEVFTDTVISKDTVRITVTLPPKTIIKTKTVTDTIIRENTARVSALEGQLKDRDITIGKRDEKITSLTNDYNDMKGKRNKWRLWFWIAVGAIGMYILLKLRRLVPF